jgi:hypothetical protein
MNKDFFNFLREIGFDKSQTRIEKYRLDGTSNYLISLNNSGITWAVSLRIPAMGVEYARFEKEKRLAVRTAGFMSEYLSNPTNVAGNVSFLFDGISSLVSCDSVLEFFNYQNSLPPLIEIDEITGANTKKTVKGESYPSGIDSLKNIDENKKESIKEYLSGYRGNFFASKGAPASETLDNCFDLVIEAANSLAVLHAKTGLKELAPMKTALATASLYNSRLNELSKDYAFPPGSPSQESFEKYQKKWNEEKKPEITRLVRKEIILRTKPGKDLLAGLIGQFEDEIQDSLKYHCFTHNDPHSENFIAVEYLYALEQTSHQYMDREFLNKIYRLLPKNDADEKISIEYIKEKNTLLYRKYNSADAGKADVNIVRRSLHYDIHLIDIDDAAGIEPETQQPYLNDLLIFAVSAANLGMIKGRETRIEDIVSAYYDFFLK